jgi:hypothetical protein
MKIYRKNFDNLKNLLINKNINLPYKVNKNNLYRKSIIGLKMNYKIKMIE